VCWLRRRVKKGKRGKRERKEKERKERKAEERPESEEVVVSSKEAHVPDHSSCRKDRKRMWN